MADDVEAGHICLYFKADARAIELFGVPALMYDFELKMLPSQLTVDAIPAVIEGMRADGGRQVKEGEEADRQRRIVVPGDPRFGMRN